MESQPQRPDFRNNSEDFHPCDIMVFPTCYKHLQNFCSMIKFLFWHMPCHFLNMHVQLSGVVTVQDSQSGKSFSSILNLARNVQKSPIKCLKEQNIHRKQPVYAYLIVNI